MKLPPGTRIKVKNGDRIGIVTCVGINEVFVKYLPFDSYCATPSIREKPESLTVIGVHPDSKKTVTATPEFGSVTKVSKEKKSRLKK